MMHFCFKRFSGRLVKSHQRWLNFTVLLCLAAWKPAHLQADANTGVGGPSQISDAFRLFVSVMTVSGDTTKPGTSMRDVLA